MNPNSRQGKDTLNKMRNLMGKMTLNENKVSTTKVELTKLGPDNKVYGIVKENHEYYIKATNKIKDVMVEDFQYIGGLQNKKEFAFESYSKALKKLNLKMISLNEQFEGDKVNVFENDHLIVGGDNTVDDSFEEFVEEDVVEEGELNVGTVINDGPKELDGNSIGKHVDSTIEPDDAPNDKSTGTEKEGAEKATPKKTIKETRKRLSILDAIERHDDIVESVLSKKKL